jgi:hypothetical protein
MPTDQDLNHIFLLETGIWKPEQLKVHMIAEKRNISLFSGDNDAIDKEWLRMLDRKPEAFIGPTIRLVGWHRNDSNLILEVIPSDYKESCLLGYLGVAMVMITKDSHVVLQGPSKHTVYGDTLRIPGCTPENTEVLSAVVRETCEEFGVVVKKKDLRVVGLIYTTPPAAPIPHYGLIVRVNCEISSHEVKQNWKNAKDKSEGKPVTIPLNTANAEMLASEESKQEIPYSSCLALLLVLNSLSNVSFVDYKWFEKLGRLGSLKPTSRICNR